MTENPEPVGYRRPPTATRFQPGRSGNPGGRPKKKRSLRDEVFDELNQSVRFSEDGKAREITKGRAIAKTLLRAALAGNLRALSILCALPSNDANESEDQSAPPEDLELLDEHIEREIRRRTNATDTEVNPSTDTPHDTEESHEK